MYDSSLVAALTEIAAKDARIKYLEDGLAALSVAARDLIGELASAADVSKLKPRPNAQIIPDTHPILSYVIDEIALERSIQDKEWGGHAHDDEHSPGDWIYYIRKQANKAASMQDYRERLTKIAALAVAAAQSYDRIMKGGE